MIRLLELRTEKGLSQRETARLMQISQGTYNNWENGRTQPSIEQLIALAELFSVSVDYLVGNSEEYGALPNATSLTNDERTLLKHFRKMNDEAKSSMLNFLEKIN